MIIDTSNPLTSGLVFAVIMQDGDTSIVDLVNSATLATSGVSTYYDSTNSVPAVRFAPTSYANVGAASVGGVDLFADADAAWSVVVIGRQANSVTYGTWLAKASATSTSRTFHLLQSTEKPQVRLRGTLTDLQATALAAGYHQLAVTWNGTTALGYVDNGSAVTCNVGTAAIETQNITMGARTLSSPDHPFDGFVKVALIYNRALTRTELDAIYADPYGLLTESGGAGNDSLTASGIAAGSPTLGTPSITQGHALGAQSILAGTPTLGTPSIPTDGNDELAATGIEAQSPTLGVPTLTSGIIGANIPSVGEHGGSPVPNDFTITPTALYAWEVVTPPSAGTLEIFADLTFTWDADGVPDGDYTWVYRLYENGVSVGTATVYMHVGALAVDRITAGMPALGTPTLTGYVAGVLLPDYFENEQTFFAPTVSGGVMIIAPSLLINNQTFYVTKIFVQGQGGCFVGFNGVYVIATPYVKRDGVWSQAEVFVKAAGTYVQL